MHILEQYALSCGVKISEPYIYTSFYPIPFEKYITIQGSSNMDSRTYDYYNEVVYLITPYLEKLNIKIVQVGGKDDKKINGTYAALGCSIEQMAYIISNSMLHFGSDSCCIHFASHFKKKIVYTVSNLYPQNAYPYWSDKDDYVFIESPKTGKPCFSFFENPKSINSIKPEQIIQPVLDFLCEGEKLNLETAKIGTEFLNKNLNVIPNCIANVNVPFIVSRLDLEYNQQLLSEQLKISKAHIITKQPIHPDILLNHRENILSVSYNIQKENQPRFVQYLQQLNIQYSLITELEGEDLQDLKIDYMDYGLIANVNKPRKQDYDFCDVKNLKYVSSKYFISNKKIYPCLAAVYEDKPVEEIFKFDPQPVIDSEEFWKQAESFYFLTND